jgi:hypothetical protein
VNAEEPMSIEDRVRTATQAGATLVRDIGPMVAEADKVRFRRRPARPLRRLLSWGIPLAAAAAVVLLALSLVTVRSTHSGIPAIGRSAAPTLSPRPGGPSPSPVPRYFVALDQGETSSVGSAGSSGSDGSYQASLIVGDDVTGTAIATVNPPSGMEFLSVQGASDDRTFVVVGGSKPALVPDAWYLLRIAPGSARPYQLAKVPIKLAGGGNAYLLAYALSPDDRELAVESQQASQDSGATVTTLGIYSVSSGAELRAWTTGSYSQELAYPDTLSWLPGGRQLSFSHIPPGRHDADQDQVRTIDVTGRGTDLLAASHVVLTLNNPPSSPSGCWTLNLTPDGGTVICGTQYNDSADDRGTGAGCASGGLEFTAYSARTGKPVRVLYKYRGPCNNGETAVLWTDSSARYVIGATETNLGNQGGQQAGQLGVITDGHLRPLNLPASVRQTDYLTVAF